MSDSWDRPARALRWREAMAGALYGPDGFFVTGGGPAAHFRTSVHASPLFAAALCRLVAAVDAALHHPPALDLVDVGAGRGELLTALLAAAPAGLRERLRPVAVEKAPRPTDLPAAIDWVWEIPSGLTGVLLATEWLDNVPLDAACAGADGAARYLLVDPGTGRETPDVPVTGPDARWLERWWPLPVRQAATEDATGDATDHATEEWQRAEIGLPRDLAWARAVACVTRGLALAVDYGHLLDSRPECGTLTGYRDGRQVSPVPDGHCDITAHVALDSAAEAGGRPYTLVRQREALHALGVDGARPPLALALSDPTGYVRALSAASAAAELTDPVGLGGHHWLIHPRGIDLAPLSSCQSTPPRPGVARCEA